MASAYLAADVKIHINMIRRVAIVLSLVAAVTGCQSVIPNIGPTIQPSVVSAELKPSGAPIESILKDTDRVPIIVPRAAGAAKQTRFVEVNIAPLLSIHSQRIILPLFEDSRFEVDGIRTERAGNGFVWIGQIHNQPNSLVILSSQADALSGNIRTEAGQNYEIGPAGKGLHVVWELVPKSFALDDINSGPSAEPLGEQTTGAEPCGGTETGAVIDVLVAYTETARANNGGKAGIESKIYSALYWTNESYIASGINQRMQIVRLLEVNYKETGNSCTDVTRLRNTADGFLDSLLTERNSSGADLVILIVDGNLDSTSQFANGQRINCAGAPLSVAGEAYNVLNPNTTRWELNAYAVVQASAASANLTFAHETGHLLGARHEVNVDTTMGSPFNDNHGFVNSDPTCLKRSVMATDGCCSRVWYWSDAPPGTPQCSQPFGTSNVADNVHVLNTTAATVANFRCSSPGRADVWMRDTWADTGAEPDPATASEPMWNSPYIWVRLAEDTALIHQHQHQTPSLNSHVFAYVKLHNGIGGTAAGDLELYFADASTGPSFPANWTLIGRTAVSNFAPFTTQVIRFPWDTPTSTPSGGGHFALVARWVSTSDPITVIATNIETIVRGSNNVVWRNIETLGEPGQPQGSIVLVVRNVAASDSRQPGGPITLRVAPVSDEINGSFFFYGRGVLTLDETIAAAWRAGGKRGSGFSELADGLLLVTDPAGAILENVLLDREGMVRLDFTRTADTPAREFHVEATQFVAGKITGGVTYRLGAK
jgi:hypothetical protein